MKLPLSAEQCIDKASVFECTGLFYRFEYEKQNRGSFRFAQVVRDTARGRDVELDLSPKPAKYAPRLSFQVQPLSDGECELTYTYSCSKNLLRIFGISAVIAIPFAFLAVISDSLLWGGIAVSGLVLCSLTVMTVLMQKDKKKFIKAFTEYLQNINERD